MKLSFSTNAFIRHPVDEAVRKIAAIGYEGVEILADVPHMFMEQFRKTEVKKLASALADSGLKVSNINANTARGYSINHSDPLFEPTLSMPEERARRWRIDYTKKCIDLAAAIGSSNVSVTSGRIALGSDPEEGMKLLKESLAEITEYAAASKVRVGLEYEPGYLIEYCSELTSLIKEIASPYFGANLDLGHSHIAGEDPEEVMDALGEKLFHVHIEDIKDRKHFHLIPGLGDLDFERILCLGANRSFDGFFTVELYTYPDDPVAAATSAYRYLMDFDVWEDRKKEGPCR